MVWQPSQPHQKTAFISQSCPPTLSIFFQCLLVWPLTELLPSELPNKIQGGWSGKLYKISFLKWSTEWKPWASFWRINTLYILNKENGLCVEGDELQTGQLITELSLCSAIPVIPWVTCHCAHFHRVCTSYKKASAISYNFYFVVWAVLVSWLNMVVAASNRECVLP